MPTFFVSLSSLPSSSSTTLYFLPPDLTFWFYVKEHLNRHELQRFYSLRQISSELGRGRAWLRCALNEHSLERYLLSLLADRPRLGLVDWKTFFSRLLLTSAMCEFTDVILCIVLVTLFCLTTPSAKLT